MPIIHTEEIRGTGVRRILYGHILTLDTTQKIYLAQRKNREIFRGGKASISGAMSEELAAWAIDEDLLVKLRVKGVFFVGVRVIDTGDLYLTRLRTFTDPKTSKLRDYTGVGRGGSRQRYVVFKHFALKKAVATIDDSALYK